MLLKDKVIVVSGVGPGMGQAMARIAAKEGAKVVAAARNKAFLDEVCGEITADGGTAIAVACDIADADQCQALAKAAADAFSGRIDGLINSAYYHGDWSFVENADEEDWAGAGFAAGTAAGGDAQDPGAGGKAAHGMRGARKASIRAVAAALAAGAGRPW